MNCAKIAQYLVLEAIKAGKAPEEIARLLDLESHDIYAVIRLLEDRRLVKRRPTFFGERYVLTEAGRRQLEEWRREVRGRAEEVARLQKEGREHEAQSLIVQLLPALPVLAVLGVLSLALWKLLASRLPVGEDK
jgi:DNA-binding MarR family transcriptional regulator